MTIRTSVAGFSLCFLAVVAVGEQVRKNVPGVTEAHGGFGLPDQSGTRLLLMPHLERPEVLKAALCRGGRRFAIQFERRQAAREGDSGRQATERFDDLAGSVFRVVAGQVDPGALCLLASDTLLAGSTLLSVGAPAGSDACVQRNRFATLRARPVIHCWPIARVAPGKQIALLEFGRRGTDALASLVLVDGSRTMFADYPAEFRKAGQDLWRADDAGVLAHEDFEVVCALQRGDWYALGIAWNGSEGRSLSLWISEGRERFTEVINEYWYQAPI